MKRTMMCAVLACLFSLQAATQNVQSLQDLHGEQKALLSVTDLECPPGSLYGQLPDGISGWSTTGAYLAEKIPVAVPGATFLSWWMNGTGIPQTFDIRLHADNAGVPGALIDSYPGVTAEMVNTGEEMSERDVYSFTFVFPAPVDLPAGCWVGIENHPDGHHHYWLTSSDGDGYAYLLPGLNQFNVDFAFCLGVTEAPEVPLSGWALIAGLVLIAGFVLLRSRRLLS
jgi:hypothetical protein